MKLVTSNCSRGEQAVAGHRPGTNVEFVILVGVVNTLVPPQGGEATGLADA